MQNVRIGRWIRINTDPKKRSRTYKCSECGCVMTVNDSNRLYPGDSCPNCSADMVIRRTACLDICEPKTVIPSNV